MKLDPFIEAEKIAGHGVQRTCALFEVSKSAYYQRRNGAPSQREITDAELLEQISAIHTESKGTEGSTRALHPAVSKMPQVASRPGRAFSRSWRVT